MKVTETGKEICQGDVQQKQQKLIRGGQQKLCIVFYW